MYSIDITLSKSINLIRFPLAFLVVLLHSIEVLGRELSKALLDVDGYYCFNFVKFLLESNICRLAVPIFFVISGFLFFYNVEEFSLSVYWQKLKSRFKTLLIPYLIWNLIVLLLHFVIEMVLPQSVSGKHISDYSFSDYFFSFLCMDYVDPGYGNTPIDGPLWFIRDLIIFCIASPLVYFVVKYLKIYSVFFLGIVWAFNLYNFNSYEMSMIFFCSLGAYMGIEKRSLLTIANKYSVYLYIGLLAFSYFVQFPYLPNLVLLVGISASLYFIAFIVNRYDYNISSFFVINTFAVYAFHMDIIRISSRLLFSIPLFQNDYIVSLMTVVQSVAITIIICFVFNLLRKYFPRVANILCGGR